MNRFSRLERMVGKAGMDRLKDAHVAVIGMGAVGGYATEALARAGVGHLRLVDFDEIRDSNINRQLFALSSTIGRKKIDVARERVLDINPACSVEAMPVFVHADSMDEVLAGPPDIVIDAIDSLTPKVELLAQLIARGIPCISSMGAALRTDPSKIRLGPLSEVSHCPLASVVRKRLRRRGLDPALITCVNSTEPASKHALVPIDESDGDTYDRGRKRQSLGSLPTLTGIFGLTAANAAIMIILDGACSDR